MRDEELRKILEGHDARLKRLEGATRVAVRTLLEYEESDAESLEALLEELDPSPAPAESDEG